jgi:hypothetical protein
MPALPSQPNLKDSSIANSLSQDSDSLKPDCSSCGRGRTAYYDMYYTSISASGQPMASAYIGCMVEFHVKEMSSSS